MLKTSDLFPADFDPKSYITSLDLFAHIPELGSDTALGAHEQSPLSAVDPGNSIPFPPNPSDLGRLHWLVVSRKVFTVLELGVGYSTTVFSEALHTNKSLFQSENAHMMRCSNRFEVHSVDNNQKWIDLFKQGLHHLSEPSNVFLHKADLLISAFNDRICSFYDPLPDISPDLIYIDGPDQNSAIGSIRGISTRHPDRMPMSADILAMEHFLQPGTLIVIDGRAANARFLQCNLQRRWCYAYAPIWDQHYFELQEDPLGRFNKIFIDYTLGHDFFRRLGCQNE